MDTAPRPFKAVVMLFVATTAWGASYLAMKALGLKQEELVPGAGTWYLTALSLLVRFGVSAVIIGFCCVKQIRAATRLEFSQGLGLGVFGGIGLMFQMDGVQHTAASTAAFLTQCYCIFIPIMLALHRREMPGKMLGLCCVMVFGGVALLSNINLKTFRLGRGEIESILASILFTGQILWLERPLFRSNRCLVTTFIMFVAVTVLVLPMAGLGAFKPGHAFASAPALWLIGFLTIGGTLATYTIMNYWQPHLPATQAGLIYCCEPLFTSVFALFLPGWLSAAAGVRYANETVTGPLLFGGGLITVANLLAVLFTLQPSPPRPATDHAG